MATTEEGVNSLVNTKGLLIYDFTFMVSCVSEPLSPLNRNSLWSSEGVLLLDVTWKREVEQTGILNLFLFPRNVERSY